MSIVILFVFWIFFDRILNFKNRKILYMIHNMCPSERYLIIFEFTQLNKTLNQRKSWVCTNIISFRVIYCAIYITGKNLLDQVNRKRIFRLIQGHLNDIFFIVCILDCHCPYMILLIITILIIIRYICDIMCVH